MSGEKAKLRIHFENDSHLGEVFECSSARIRTALSCRGTLAEKVDISIGCDGNIFAKALRTAEVLVGWNFPRDELSSKAPNLRWIHAIGAGVEKYMPLDWLPRGVIFTNNKGVHGERASEYAIMALLAINNRLPEMFANQRRAEWRQIFNTNISGKTLLIIGVGHIGGDVARWAKRFQLRVIGIRRSGKSHRHVDAMYRPSDLRKLLPEADFVLVSAPETETTRHMISSKELDLLKHGAGIVVYSRAGLVDYDALRRKLEKGELSAVLDVFEAEPLPTSSALWKAPNLIITPHCSSDDPGYYIPRTLDLVFENVERYLAGKDLRNRVSRVYQY